MAIKKIWFLVSGFLLGAPLSASAVPAKPAGQQNVEESSSADDKAAVQQAASEADQWAAKHKDVKKPAATAAPAADASDAAPANPASLPGVTADSPSNPTPDAASAPAAHAAAKPRVPGLNEMKGKLLSVSDDPKTFRLLVDGGFNVEFTYDTNSSVVNGGDPLKMSDLGYNDSVVVRYAGKDLYAVEVVRVSKAPRPE